MANDTAHTAHQACRCVNRSQVAKDTAHTAQRAGTPVNKSQVAKDTAHDVQTDRISVCPPPRLKRCPKWVLSHRKPSRALQVPSSPKLGVLNSIVSLIPLNQALGHPKMRSSGSRPTEFLFIHPPPKRC